MVLRIQVGAIAILISWAERSKTQPQISQGDHQSIIDELITVGISIAIALLPLPNNYCRRILPLVQSLW
jgi:phosphatidylglycerophosphatase A